MCPFFACALNITEISLLVNFPFDMQICFINSRLIIQTGELF